MLLNCYIIKLIKYLKVYKGEKRERERERDKRIIEMKRKTFWVNIN